MTFELDYNEFGFYEGECLGCDIFTRVDDVGLCEECAAKLDRDLVRQRDWQYSKVAYGVPPEKREELRGKVIRQYGANLELIVGDEVEKSKPRRRRRGKRRQRS
ncbi:MAG: hypothetical protein ACYS74_10330 [Planctomycetota bacterium]|jgi:hypothetical protein